LRLERRGPAPPYPPCQVDSRLAPADESLAALLAEHGPGSFDFAFIDADKRAYPRYFEACLQLVRPGGLIAVDNVLFYGKVADEQVGEGCASAPAGGGGDSRTGSRHAPCSCAVRVPRPTPLTRPTAASRAGAHRPWRWAVCSPAARARALSPPRCRSQVQDKATAALREFNASVLADPRVTLSIVPVGDGMALCRKR
jgi:predicted O-methyltransferase YrrM